MNKRREKGNGEEETLIRERTRRNELKKEGREESKLEKGGRKWTGRNMMISE